MVNMVSADNDGKLSKETKALTSLNGKIVDEISGEALVGVKVEVEGLDKPVYTDFDGNFEVKNIYPGKYNISTTYISYENSFHKNVSVQYSDNKFTFGLKSVSGK